MAWKPDIVIYTDDLDPQVVAAEAARLERAVSRGDFQIGVGDRRLEQIDFEKWLADLAKKDAQP